jgi:hypothetical protein
MNKKFFAAFFISAVFASCGGNTPKQPELSAEEQQAVESKLESDERAMDSLEQLIKMQVEADSSLAK